MNCTEPSALDLFVRGELPSVEIARLEEHLDVCNVCMEAVARIAQAEISKSPASSNPEQRRDSVWVHLVAALARSSDLREDAGPVSAPDRIGPYRVLQILGKGGMGVVYRAAHEGSGAVAAVKTVLGPSERQLAALRIEIDFLRSHTHPGIVRIVEDGIIEGSPWYAMEFLEGRTLAEFNSEVWSGRARPNSSELPAAAGGQLSRVVALFLGLCEPLAFVHQAGVVHCDLKPGNVFVRAGDRPVLMDFGLLLKAHGAMGREVLEVGGRLRGTLPYLSPELIRGALPDARADLYALGCLLYESVAGRPPFEARTASALLEAHLHRTPPPLSTLVSRAPDGLQDLLTTLLAKRPERRLGDANQVADALGALLDRGTPAPRTRPTPAPYLFRPRIVGRDDVLGHLRELRDEAARSRGSMAVVTGESGIGKTFLASEVAGDAARSDLEVLAGGCTPFTASASPTNETAAAPLGPFRNLLRVAGDRSLRDAPGAVFRLFGSERNVQLLGRYEPNLLHLLGSGPLEPVSPLPPSAERERVLQAMADVLAAIAAQTPLTLVVDDIQWADDLSLAFLDLLASGFLADKPIFILVLCRSDEISPAIESLLRRECVHPVPLRRLDADSMRVLIGDLLAVPPPPEFVTWISGSSEGNPFFVAEYLRTAVAEGRLQRDRGGWDLGQDAGGWRRDIALPPSLQGLLERRLSLLSPDAQRVAEAAAVLGRECLAPMLAAVAELPGDRLAAAVAEMVERQVVERAAADGLRFLHDKTREAAYARIDAGRQRDLHRRAAATLEAVHAGSQLKEHFAELAYHHRSADQIARAMDYFEGAAQQALARSANADVVRFLGEAKELSRTPGLEVTVARRALWERQLGDALLGLGDVPASLAHLRTAVALLGRPMADSSRAIAVGITLRAGQQVLHMSVPTRWLRGDAAPDRLDAARAYERLLQGYYYSGDYTRLLLANLTTLNLAERHEPSATLAAAYANAAMTASIIPLWGLAHRYFRLARETLAAAYDVEVESYERLMLSVFHTGLGAWDDALATNARALELAEALGFHRRWDEAAGVRVWLLSRSTFPESVAWAHRLFDSASRRTDRQMMMWGLMGEGNALARAGDTRGVDALIARQRALVPEPGLPEELSMLGLNMFSDSVRGDLATASVAADRAELLVKKAGGPIHLHCVDAYARVVEVRLRTWKAAKDEPTRRRAQLQARAALSMLGRASTIFPVARPIRLLLCGLERHLTRQPAAAAALWQKARTSAQELRMPFEEAAALEMLAGAGASNAGMDAQALCRRLGISKTGFAELAG